MVFRVLSPFAWLSATCVLLLGSGCGTSGGGAARDTKGAKIAGKTMPHPHAGRDAGAVERRIQAHAHYASGVVHDLNDRTAEAVEAYYQAGLLDSGNESMVLDVTRRFMQLKEADKALVLLEKATARPDATGALFTRLAAVHVLMGRTNQALACARMAIKRSPDHAAGYQQVAQLLIQTSQFEEGLKVLREANQDGKLPAEGLVSLAELCLALSPVKPDRTQELRKLAETLLNQAESSKPNHPAVLQRMADAFLFLGKSEEASGIYARLLERFPQLPGLRERLTDLYLTQQETDKASRQLESILSDQPTNIRAHYLLGSLAYEAKDLAKARDHFRKVILLNPDFEQVYYDLAGTQINLKDFKGALETLETVRGKFKLRFVLELYTGLAYSQLKDYSKSVKHFEAAEIVARAAETNRLTHVFFFQLGAAYERNKQFQEAEVYFRKSLDQSPDFSEALNYLGYMWAERGENLEEAREMIERAVKLEPENAAYLDSMGWVVFKLNRPHEALDYVLKAIRLMEEPDAVLFDHVGDIYFALKQPDKAKEAWKKSLDLEPSADIRKKLEDAQADSSSRN